MNSERKFIIIVFVIIMIKSYDAIHRIVLSEALDQLLNEIRLQRCFNLSLQGWARSQLEKSKTKIVAAGAEIRT